MHLGSKILVQIWIFVNVNDIFERSNFLTILSKFKVNFFMRLLYLLLIGHHFLDLWNRFIHLFITIFQLIYLTFLLFYFGLQLHLLHYICLVICLHFFEFGILNFKILAQFFIFRFKYSSSGIILIQILLADVLNPLLFD